MDAIEMIKERRSIRKFKNEKVDRDLMKEIVSISRFAPSWGNFQVARYTLVDDPDLIRKIADEGVHGFNYNINSLRNAPGVAILSYVKGKSGRLEKIKLQPNQEHGWELFDTGIACQTFCLASHAKGIGTVIMGVINQDEIAKIIDLPSDQQVSALIAYGYEEIHPKPTRRKDVDEILRFVD
ncbi:MAG: nitroreductase family protein [Sphaerochaetaceae bacterium]|nr:nitroreductase family protein [Sphaerochaetaceae bacterium]